MDRVHTNVSVLSSSCSFSLPSSSSFLRMVNGKCFALLVYLYRMQTHTALELKRKPRACLSLVSSMKSRGGRGKIDGQLWPSSAAEMTFLFVFASSPFFLSLLTSSTSSFQCRLLHHHPLLLFNVCHHRWTHLFALIDSSLRVVDCFDIVALFLLASSPFFFFYFYSHYFY